MVVFLLGLILFSLSAPLSLWLRQKVEALLPAAMLGIILVLYVAGLFGSLAAGFYLVLGLCAVIIGVSAWVLLTDTTVDTEPLPVVCTAKVI